MTVAGRRLKQVWRFHEIFLGFWTGMARKEFFLVQVARMDAYGLTVLAGACNVYRN